MGCRHAPSSGFTLLEMLVTMVIITILVSLVSLNYASFSSRSSLRVRVDEVVESLRFIQEASASARRSSGSDVGLQSIRLQVRNGVFQDLGCEFSFGFPPEVSSSEPFVTTLDTSNNKCFSALIDSPTSSCDGYSVIGPRSYDRYYVDACFITIEVKNNKRVVGYSREELKLSGTTCAAKTSMLCSEPDPSVSSARATEAEKNNFDIHFSAEQPTREIHTNIFPFNATTKKYVCGDSEPNGNGSRLFPGSKVGLRVVFISPTGFKRNVDVYSSGLIETGVNGCP